MRRTRMFTLVLMVVALLLGGNVASPMPAGGSPPASGNDWFYDVPITVNGDYHPVVGRRTCSGDGWFILWYASGPAADHLWSIDSFEPLDYESEPVSVTGTYEPLIGDFDGNGCDDIFWYAAGTHADFIWWGETDGSFTSQPVTVNGHYQPVVGDFDGHRSDIFWYAPGAGQEYLWQGAPGRSWTKDTGPTVNGTYRTTALHDRTHSIGGDQILFHDPGTAPDYLWRGIDGGATVPESSEQRTYNGDYRPIATCCGLHLLYGEGGAPDYLVDEQHAPWLEDPVPATINGTYSETSTSSSAASIVVWHAPGSAQDYVWLLD